ncbi:hypothetical protein BGZ99_000148 [Dissophora globulifera]|uniref:Short-chain dehydrogenase n=1 Tax=Dissophora globulifera TaxID=979702 RepID=A0A9P6R5V3_9FUNG|nr:hypothetical protein BGZ99_000148 [Dissophora globulifera]
MATHAPAIIVTGASRGIGRSVVLLAIQKLGANVIGVARSREALQQLSQHIEGDLNLKDRFKFVVGDVTAESTSQEAVALALKSWGGKVDGLVLNAGGIEPIGSIATTTVEGWKKAFDINFFSILTTVQHTLPALRESKGRVIFVSSGAAIKPLHGWGAYCSSKAALKMFCESLAVEEPELTAISIRPGVVDTEMQSTIRSKGVDNMTPDQHAKFIDLHASKALLHPDEPGHVIASLAVQAPASLTGKFFSWDDEPMNAYRKK